MCKQGIDKELEEQTLQFLRKNDKYYYKKNKKNLMEYNYIAYYKTPNKEILFDNNIDKIFFINNGNRKVKRKIIRQ